MRSNLAVGAGQDEALREGPFFSIPDSARTVADPEVEHPVRIHREALHIVIRPGWRKRISSRRDPRNREERILDGVFKGHPGDVPSVRRIRE